MTENEAWELYKKRKKARLKGRGLRKDADGNWITIKGTHVQIGDDGEITGKVADKIKASSKNRKAKKVETSDSLKPQNTDYDYDPKDDLQGFIHKNVSKTKPIYKEHGMEGVEDEWFKTRMQNCTKDFKRISDDEIDAILENNINYGTARLWLLEYDHEVKPALAMQLTMNPEVHNAALNIMYKNYESYMKYTKHEEPLPFEEFLVTPIKMYRGGSGKEYEKASVFSSYTFSDDVAKKFKTNPSGHGRPEGSGVVYEAEVRPIDTYGSLNTSGEMEVFVPKFVAPNGKYDSAEINVDADDEEKTERHGNTKIPFGLCQREGIRVQPGWTPKDAWKALEGKGYSVGAVYKELKETGKVSEKKRRPLIDIQKEYDDSKSDLESAVKKRDKAKENYEMSKMIQPEDDDPDVDDELREMCKKDLIMTRDEYEKAQKEVDELTKKEAELKKEIEHSNDKIRKKSEEDIRHGVTSFVRDEKVVKAIASGEKAIRNQSYESGVCIDRNGNKIFDASDGEKSSIDLTRYAEQGILKDAVFTHNHPGGSTFSEEDISTAVSQGMAEIRACYDKGAYSLVRQYSLDGEKPEGYDDFAWDYYQAYMGYKKNVVDVIWRRGPQVQEVAFKCNDMISNYRRNWLKDNSRKYGWVYTEETK